MNAVVERSPQPTVALLGPADDARTQLRNALQALGAELVFEGELKEATGLQSDGLLPRVLLVNLEPGVEDELDALQDLLDHPEVSVVFNEGEVSSRLSGWDLARWARHLAAKVLGVRDTLPPLPQGAERLPVLDLMPEPGRPVTPAQQQEHLVFDDYADEALGLQHEVPSSPRLDVEAPLPPLPDPPRSGQVAATPTVEAAAESVADFGFDFDFSPVATETAPAAAAESGSHAHDGDSGPSAQPEVDLDQVDLESVFDQGLEQLTPDDLLLKLQAAMGLEQRVLPPQPSPEARAVAAQAASESAAEAAQQALESFEFEAKLSPSEAPPAGESADSDAAPLAFSFDPVEAEFETSSFDAEPAAFDTMAPGAAAAAEAETEAHALGAEQVGWSLSDADEAPVDSNREASGLELESALDVADFDAEPLGVAAPSAEGDSYDFSAFEVSHETGFVSDEHAALGGSLELESSADDEEIARLAAALDRASEAQPLPVEVDPLDFSHLRKDPTPEPPEARRAVPPQPATASPAAGFGDLSLAPLEAEPLPVAPQAAAPAASFDFSGIELSLEPLEGEEPPPEQVIESATRPDALTEPHLAEHAELRDQPVDEVTDTSAFEPVEAVDALAVSEAVPPPPFAASAASGVSRVVVLCASIGGPDAVRNFLDGLPAGFPALFLVVQHLESGYFERLAQQLQKASKLPVRVPMAGTAARDGEVLVVSSDSRLLVSSDGTIELAPLASDSRYRPCIDDVLRDVADTFGSRAVAVIFSGMAADAVEGAVYLTQRGGEVWAQDPESCVVSSMVDGARARGVVEFVGSPRELSAQCMRRLRLKSSDSSSESP